MYDLAIGNGVGSLRVQFFVMAVALATFPGCAKEIGGGAPVQHDAGPSGADGGADDAGYDGGLFGNADPSASQGNRDAGLAPTGADAFFADDPPPMYCGPDGGEPERPGGTAECPDDKNRQGCPCPEAGMEAACWPGKRIHRNHGICRDGTTVCREEPEFGLRWGPCEDYMLPDENAGAGPEACGCFSSGTWSLDNIAPCIFTTSGGETYIYSSKKGEDGNPDCSADQGTPPAPEGTWSEDTLNVDCGGSFELCFTIKAGDVANPRDSDCVVTRYCVDVFYPEAGVTQELPPIPAWTAQDSDCAASFERMLGYGEMSVFGESVECDAIDDGAGNPYVFHRTNYCPPECQQTPDTEECRECRIGGSGMFGL